MPLTLNINSSSVKMELPDTTIQHYRFDYAEASNYAKGNTDLVKLSVTVNLAEILSLNDSSRDNIKTIKDLRDWAEKEYIDEDSKEEYYHGVILKNYFGDKEIRQIELSDAFVNKSTESIDPLTGKHMLTLELLQREDKIDYIK